MSYQLFGTSYAISDEASSDRFTVVVLEQL
jgi:hypothetical protein